MEIHFCDLCNESVPAADLDRGQAFLRKGRVVCAKCDALMTQAESAAGPIGAGGATAPKGQPGGSKTQPESKPGAPGQRAAVPYPVHLRSRGGAGPAIAVGLFAILLTALAAGFLYDRAEQTRGQLQRRIDSLSNLMRDEARRSEQRDQTLERTLAELSGRIVADLDDARSAVETSLERTENKAEETLGKVDEFKGDLVQMKESIGLIQRHESELLSLQQKLTQLSDEVGALGSVLAEMEQSQRDQTAVHREAAPQQAAWLGILPQLESVNSGDRWTAVQQLGETHDPAVADHLLPLLKDSDIFVRMATARVLGDLGAPHAAGALIDALEDAESPVREAAYVALQQVTKRNLPFDPNADPAERARRVKAWRDWWKKEPQGTSGT